MASLLDFVRSLTSKNTRGNTVSTPTGTDPFKLPDALGGPIINSTNGQLGLNPYIWGEPTNTTSTQDPYAGLDLGGTTGGTGGGTDPYADLQNQIRDRINKIMGVYDSLDSGVDAVVKERSGNYLSDYDRQQEDLSKAFGNNSQQQANAYGARGLSSSSYFTDAQNESKDIYNQGISDIAKNRDQTLGGLGQYAATTKAQFGAGRSQYNDILNNLSQYDPSSLTGLYDTLGSNLTGLESQRAGLGTTGDFITGLNKITPTQNNATGQLATKLQKLITSSAPQFAKDQIAQGLIKSAQLTDPNANKYWQNYYQQLLSGVKTA